MNINHHYIVAHPIKTAWFVKPRQDLHGDDTFTNTAQSRNSTSKQTLAIVDRPREIDHQCPQYMPTPEAARYIRKSVSWLLRCGVIPFMPGKPNVYARRDLDAWFESNKHVPRN